MALAQEPDKGETEKRRGGGFRRPSDTARANLALAGSKLGFAEPDVLLRWPEIVGEALADLCAPVKVTYPRDHGLTATLVVRCSGPRAPEVEHMGPLIVERVNQFYGYRAVGRVKVVQTTSPAPAPNPGFAEPAAAFAGPGLAAAATPAVPTARDEAEAARLTRNIRDPDLRAALTRMGAHVLARRKPDTSAS